MKWAGRGCRARGIYWPRLMATPCGDGVCSAAAVPHPWRKRVPTGPSAGCNWQLSASLSLPPSMEKIGAGIAGKTPNATAAPSLLPVDSKGGCLDPSAGTSTGFLQLGPAWCSILGASHPI